MSPSFTTQSINKKTIWVTPMFTIIGRAKSEENILLGCKITTQSGSFNTHGDCLYSGALCGSDCRTPSASWIPQLIGFDLVSEVLWCPCCCYHARQVALCAEKKRQWWGLSSTLCIRPIACLSLGLVLAIMISWAPT